ncbi:MAG: hypothetical protein GY852_09610 [bacterium]|nr:hypothetical protein [bacterium]
MGSKEKARTFLEASEAPEHFWSIIEFTLTYFIARAEREGNSQFAEQLKRARDDYKEDFNKALTITEDVYCEIFNDEELEELIVMHATTPITKLRALTPKIMNTILEKYSLLAN